MEHFQPRRIALPQAHRRVAAPAFHVTQLDSPVCLNRRRAPNLCILLAIPSHTFGVLYFQRWPATCNYSCQVFT
jgi:hypothetical protein